MRKTFCIILLLLCAMILGQAVCAETIGQIKTLPMGAPVVVSGVVTWIKGFECYVQSEDRIAGIWVQGNTIGIDTGDKVTVAGTLAMDSYELVVCEADIYPTGQAGSIAPFAMSNRTVAGAYAFQQFKVQDRVSFKIPGDGTGYRWDYAGGASNVGMLVKTWGTVKSTYYSAESDLKWFILDDGSGVTADFGDRGVIVYSSADVNQGDVVSVTGVSSVELAFDQPDKLIRVIRPRSVADVEVLKAHKTELGFSDEFDGTEIDPRWTLVSGDGSFGIESGSLVVAPLPTTTTGWFPTYYPERLAQLLPGDYDLDVKLRTVFVGDTSLQQAFYIELAANPMIDVRSSAYVPTYALAILQKTGGVTVQVGSTAVTTAMPGDTCYFKMTCRNGEKWGSVSFDGSEYTEAYAITGSPILCVYGTEKAYNVPQDHCKAYIDYIRITPVNE